MAQNYRNQSGRSDQSRGGRDQSNFERSQADWPHYDGNDRTRSDEGGPGRGFGYRGSNRDDDFSSRDVGNSPRQGRDRGNYYGAGQSRGSAVFDERLQQGAGDRNYGGAEDFYERSRGTSTSRWHEDAGDAGGYFNTGSYIDEGDGWRGLGRDFYRARAQQQTRTEQERDMGSYRDRNTSGDYSNYGRSDYGSQSNYGRGQNEESQSRPWRGSDDYEDRSSWNYGRNRGESYGPNYGRSYGRSYGMSAGSGSSGGSYGRDSQLSGRNYGSLGHSQSFRGRGPQGYQRSDERLKEMICERLTDDPAIDASNITIEVTNQIVKLTGTVDDRSTKYEVEELVEQMGGVKDLDNQLRVQSSRQQSGTTSGQQPVSGSTSSRGSSGASTTGAPTTPSPSKRN